MSAKQNATGSLLVDPTGKPAGPFFLDSGKAATECKRRNEALRTNVDAIVGNYYHLVEVEVVND